MEGTIKEKHKASIKKVLKEKEEIVVAYLFGSHVKHYATKKSDIDIGILLTEEDAYPFRTVTNIAVTLEKKLGKNVDLHVLNGKDPRFLHTVLQHAIVLCSRDEERRISFEATVLSTYLDMKPFYKKFDDRVKQRFT